MGRPAWEGSTDKRWCLSGGSAVQVHGHSTTGQERGGKKRVLRYREADSTGRRCGAIWDWSGVREKRNE